MVGDCDGECPRSAGASGAVLAAAVEAFGRIDVVVNNAGILRDEAIHKLTDKAWAAVTGVHLEGTVFVSRAAFRRMREQGYGRVVNTTSPAGLYGNFGQTSYGAAKMGVVGVTLVLAIEGAGKGIKVNAVAPGARARMTEEMMGPFGDLLTCAPNSWRRWSPSSPSGSAS